MKHSIAWIVAIIIAPIISNSQPFDFHSTLPVGEAKGLIVIAPAKKYLMDERLFTVLAKKLSSAGYIAVRFNWAKDTLKESDKELSRAYRDINQVLSLAQTKYQIPSARTVLVTKSFSTKAIRSLLGSTIHQVLLTPNCSTDSTFKHSYGILLQQNQVSISIFISKADPYCDVRQMYQMLVTEPYLPSLYVTKGDHNFVKTDSTGPTYKYQDQIVDMVVLDITTALQK